MVREHLRKYLKKQGYDVWDQEEKEILQGVKADLIASTRGKVLAVETKGSGGSIKEAVGQAVTYLVSDLVSESYVAIPKDLSARSPYAKEVCEAVGIGLFIVEDSGEVFKESSVGRRNGISSASLWGNRRNGAPDTNRLTDLKLAVLAVANGFKTTKEIVSYIQSRRPKIRRSEPIREKWAQVFLDDATQMGLTIRRLDGTYILSPLGKTVFEMNPSPDVIEQEKELLWSSIFNFPVAYMVFRIVKEKEKIMSEREILDEGKRLEGEIAMDGIFQTEFRKKYHLNEQRLRATLNLMRDLGILEIGPDGVKFSL